MSVSDALAALRNKRKKLSGCSDELERKGSPAWAGGEGEGDGELSLNYHKPIVMMTSVIVDFPLLPIHPFPLF